MTKQIYQLGLNRDGVTQAILQAPEGFIVEIKEPNRTYEQNALYWASLNDLSEKLFVDGKCFTPDVWHIYFKQRFLSGKFTELPNKQVILLEPTTTGLSKKEFSDYVEQVFAFCAEHT